MLAARCSLPARVARALVQVFARLRSERAARAKAPPPLLRRSLSRARASRVASRWLVSLVNNCVFIFCLLAKARRKTGRQAGGQADSRSLKARAKWRRKLAPQLQLKHLLRACSAARELCAHSATRSFSHSASQPARQPGSPTAASSCGHRRSAKDSRPRPPAARPQGWLAGRPKVSAADLRPLESVRTKAARTRSLGPAKPSLKRTSSGASIGRD